MSKFQRYQLPPAGVNRVILSGAQWPQTSAEVSEARDFRMGSRCGIDLAFSEKTAFGSQSRLDAHGIARNPVQRLSTPSGYLPVVRGNAISKGREHGQVYPTRSLAASGCQNAIFCTVFCVFQKQ